MGSTWGRGSQKAYVRGRGWQVVSRAEPREEIQVGEVREPRGFEEKGRLGPGQEQGRISVLGAHRTHDTHDALPQQPRVDVIGTLAATLEKKAGGEGQGGRAPAQAPRPVLRGRYTVCSTTMGMSGIARAAVVCKFRCRARPVSGIRCVGKRAARRGHNAGHLPAATRVPPTSIPLHIPPLVPPGFRPMAELQFPGCSAHTALALWAAHFPEVGWARSEAGRSPGRKWAPGKAGEVSEPPVRVPFLTNSS